MDIRSIDSISKLGTQGDGIGKIDARSTEISSGEDSASGRASTFGDLLKSALQDANQSQMQANHSVEELVSGKNKDLHGAVIAMEKADIDFRLLTQVRNKVIDAYREIMRMQV